MVRELLPLTVTPAPCVLVLVQSRGRYSSLLGCTLNLKWIPTPALNT